MHHIAIGDASFHLATSPFYAIIHLEVGDSMKKSKLFFIIFLSVFVLFLVCFFVASALIQNGVITIVEFTSSMQGILASIVFFPLVASLFFLGQLLKSKSGVWQNIYKVLNFVSIALFCYIVVIMIVSFLG